MPERLTPALRAYVVTRTGCCPACGRVGTAVLAHDDAGEVTPADLQWVASQAVQQLAEILDRVDALDAVAGTRLAPYGEEDEDDDTPEEARLRGLAPPTVPPAFTDALHDLDTEGL